VGTQRTQRGSTGSNRPCAVDPEIARLDPADRPHLSAESFRGGDSLKGASSDGDRQWFCEHDTCRARITVSPDGKREYGHSMGLDGRMRICPLIEEMEHNRNGGGVNEGSESA